MKLNAKIQSSLLWARLLILINKLFDFKCILLKYNAQKNLSHSEFLNMLKQMSCEVGVSLQLI